MTDMQSLAVRRADIDFAYETVRSVVRRTPLELSERLSAEYGARIYLKREDLQTVRSYKIRGAYNRMSRLTVKERADGIVCASAGNHAQGVARSCDLLGTPGAIFMPRNTPRQKVERVRALGGPWVTLELIGDTFDEAKGHAARYAADTGKTVIHPFDDPAVVAGQGTVAREIAEQMPESAEIVLAPVGGGGLLAGSAVYFADASPGTRLIGVEPAGAASLQAALAAGHVVALDRIDTFVDGAAVQAAGEVTRALCAALVPGTISRLITVPEGHVCTTMIALYQSDGIIAEPAGALTVAALDSLRDEIAGKAVVCIVSGGNNDISRYPEVLERSLVYQGLKHYFLIEFSQRAGALRQYLDDALGPRDDITLFEYVKKNNREFGATLVGIELSARDDLEPLLARMATIGLRYQMVEAGSLLHRFLV
jgi:threonine dehydratase